MNCFIFHEWSKWEEIGVKDKVYTIVNVFGDSSGTITRICTQMKRVCQKCGEIQFKQVEREK